MVYLLTIIVVIGSIGNRHKGSDGRGVSRGWRRLIRAYAKFVSFEDL